MSRRWSLKRSRCLPRRCLRHVGLTVSETSDATVVSAEPAQLQQVVLNLCNNAAQAMDEPGMIEIRIEVRETLNPLRVGRGRSRPRQLRRHFDFRSGARHG